MTFEDPTRQNGPSLAEQGCTCRKNEDGTLYMFNRHSRDDCAFVRKELRQKAERDAHRRQGW